MGETKQVIGEASWSVRSPSIEASVTVAGGMMAPVTFVLPDGRSVEPYYVSPWHAEDRSGITPDVLKPLRGDFFCLPFGGANDRPGEHHEPHGESAWASWDIVDLEAQRLRTRIAYKAGGTIVKTITLDSSQPVIYTEHEIAGFSGSYPIGHHAILAGAGPNDDASVPRWRIMTKPFDLGMTDPGYTVPYKDGEYYALEPGARFERLEEVPTRWRTPATTDCSRFPLREGFIDILAWYRQSVDVPAWTVAVNVADRYAWFSIKDPRVLPATVMWIENRGRHGEPWNGRNSCLGIEETCSYFAAGLAAPVDGGNVGAAGIPTTVELSAQSATTVRTVQGVFPIGDTSPDIVDLDLSDGVTRFIDSAGGAYPLEIDARWVMQ